MSNCGCTSNPVMAGDAQSLFARNANFSALQAKQGGGAFINGALNFQRTQGSAVVGNFAADNNKKIPNKIKLIVDTTANSGIVTDFALFDNQGGYKTKNTALQATAGVGVTYGLTAGDTTKVYLNQSGNTSGYTNLMSQFCSDGFLMPTFEVWTVTGSTTSYPSLDMRIDHYSFKASEWQKQEFLNTMDNQTCTDELKSIFNLDQTLVHFPALACLVISQLAPGKLYYFNFAIAGA